MYWPRPWVSQSVSAVPTDSAHTPSSAQRQNELIDVVEYEIPLIYHPLKLKSFFYFEDIRMHK